MMRTIGKGNRIIKYAIALIFICGMFFNSKVVLGEDVKVRIDVDSLTLVKGKSTKIVVTIFDEGRLESIEVEGLEKFKVLSTGQSASSEMINGVSSSKRSVIYTVMPLELGKFHIGATIVCDGKSYDSNRLLVDVKERSEGNDEAGEEIFIKTILSNKEIFFGEKLGVTYELFTRVNLDGFRFMEEVNVDEGITKHIPKEEYESELVYLNNNKYARYEVEKMFVSPIKAGAIRIPEYNFVVNTAAADIFSSGERNYLQTKGYTVNVLPLPNENKPEDFSGVVGELNIESKYNHDTVNYGDAINLKVSLWGSCNLDNIKSIITKDIDGFEVYESEKLSEESIEDGKYMARKEFEIILVPNKTGELIIDPIAIPYFDTVSKSYKIAEIQGKAIMVTGKAPKEGIQDGSEAGAVSRVVINQVNYETEKNEYFTIRIKKKSFRIAVASFVILMVIILAIIYTFKGKKKDKELEKIYKRVKKAKNESDLYIIFNDMVKYKFGISIKASSRDFIKTNIKDEKILAWTMEILDDMENKENNITYRALKGKIRTVYSVCNGI